MHNLFSKKPTRLIASLGFLLLAIASITFFQKQSVAKEKPIEAPIPPRLAVKVVPVGPSQSQLDSLNNSLPNQLAVAALLQGSNYRYLYTELIDSSGNKREMRFAAPSYRFRAFFYDYSKQRAVVAEGSLSNPSDTTAHIESGLQPLPNDAEFQDAITLLMQNSFFGPAINSRNLATYHPMPPVREQVAGKSRQRQRIILVGVMPSEDGNGFQNEIVGVNLAEKTILRYPKGSPREAGVEGSACGVDAGNQSTIARGTSGQYQLTVTDGATTLWDMVFIRPAASSGTRASAIELRDVKYKGISVLKRAHVPILNIKYVGDPCGPYRDWQWQEGSFQACRAEDPNSQTPGFLDCGTSPATTEIENGTDMGNFRGVVLYRQGSEVVLVSEMEAGWYRYISEWRFDTDGTIRPRFGFGAIVNACTCQVHDHHMFYRFDFDVNGTANSIYELPNKSVSSSQPDFLRPTGLIPTEKKIFRTGNLMHRYRIKGGARSYVFTPGANDGEADAYAGGDMWFLHYKTGATNLQAEIDDGRNPFNNTNTEANLDQFLTNESLVDQDSVIWYHASFHHTPDSSADAIPRSNGIAPQPQVLSGDHVVGPDLTPENW